MWLEDLDAFLEGLEVRRICAQNNIHAGDATEEILHYVAKILSSSGEKKYFTNERSNVSKMLFQHETIKFISSYLQSAMTNKFQRSFNQLNRIYSIFTKNTCEFFLFLLYCFNFFGKKFFLNNDESRFAARTNVAILKTEN